MKLVMNMVRKSFKKGGVIFDISEKSDDLYLINAGMVQIESGEGMVLATLSKGEMFGEMASILGERERTARTVAQKPAVIFKNNAVPAGRGRSGAARSDAGSHHSACLCQ